VQAFQVKAAYEKFAGFPSQEALVDIHPVQIFQVMGCLLKGSISQIAFVFLLPTFTHTHNLLDLRYQFYTDPQAHSDLRQQIYTSFGQPWSRSKHK
jgi:hypothetical protein